jgi:hypothetical protein
MLDYSKLDLVGAATQRAREIVAECLGVGVQKEV